MKCFSRRVRRSRVIRVCPALKGNIDYDILDFPRRSLGRQKSVIPTVGLSL